VDQNVVIEIFVEVLIFCVVLAGALYRYGNHIKNDLKEYVQGRYVEEKEISEVKQILSGISTSIDHILHSIDKLEKQNAKRTA
tara:strand:- start:8 stop:256 length:249 start_codon:yes stop_codon:yes gene_type:complete